MAKYIENIKLLSEQGELVETSITIEDGKISAIGGEKPENAEVIDGKGNFVSPGFVDVHVH